MLQNVLVSRTSFPFASSIEARTFKVRVDDVERSNISVVTKKLNIEIRRYCSVFVFHSGIQAAEHRRLLHV
jgi:hypothetical protein